MGNLGPSIKYVMLFLTNFDPPVILCHTSRDPAPKVLHTTWTLIFSGPSTKTGQKPPVQNLSIVRGGVVKGSFVWKVLSGVLFAHSIPLLSEYICYNRKLSITLNFTFICMIKNL